MRFLHILLAVVALVSVALLPGPSRATAAAAPVAHHGSHQDRQHDGHMAMADHGADAPREHCPAHGPCKTCSLACCAQAVIGFTSPILAPLVLAATIRATWRAVDDRRPGTADGQLLRPPTGA